MVRVHDWNGIGSARLDRARQLPGDLRIADAIGARRNTLKLAVVFVVVVNAIGLSLCAGAQPDGEVAQLLRALFFAPVVLSPLAVAFVWQYIFQLRRAAEPRCSERSASSPGRKAWVGDPGWALWTIFVVLVWQFAGLSMVIYLAGLQSIPEELDEAAAVDGASACTASGG